MFGKIFITQLLQLRNASYAIVCVCVCVCVAVQMESAQQMIVQCNDSSCCQRRQHIAVFLRHGCVYIGHRVCSLVYL